MIITMLKVLSVLAVLVFFGIIGFEAYTIRKGIN